MVEVSLTVGKLDASIAMLLTSDHHLIEFPSILLPSSVQAGSIVKINCTQDFDAERKDQQEFDDLQSKIFELYGRRSPIRPQLRVRNATQTSIVLEWDPLDLATADLRSLSLYRNNTRLGRIPSPMTNTSTKLSGLSIDTAYTFHLELATSAGTYVSDKITVKTHKMTDLSGITCCLGIVSDEDRAILDDVVARIGAKPLQDRVRIDTTHFICSEGSGAQWERALETNIPIVRPEWLRACESEGRIVGVRSYYLNVDPTSMPPLRSGASPSKSSLAPSTKAAASLQPGNKSRSRAPSPSQSPARSPARQGARMPAPSPTRAPASAPAPSTPSKPESVPESKSEPVPESSPEATPAAPEPTPVASDPPAAENLAPVSEVATPEPDDKEDPTTQDDIIQDGSGDIGSSQLSPKIEPDSTGYLASTSSVDKFEDPLPAETDGDEMTEREEGSDEKKFEDVVL
ncbi:uncharacterized protein V1518DRAFT_409798 [Limtongia smithiae]|uniref:uncharacterized protein n=1 Tax=Limtongia smithiae TaxID=1125753 RepID=UPI0034CF13C5